MQSSFTRLLQQGRGCSGQSGYIDVIAMPRLACAFNGFTYQPHLSNITIILRSAIQLYLVSLRWYLSQEYRRCIAAASADGFLCNCATSLRRIDDKAARTHAYFSLTFTCFQAVAAAEKLRKEARCKDAIINLAASPDNACQLLLVQLPCYSLSSGSKSAPRCDLLEKELMQGRSRSRADQIFRSR